MTPPDAMQGVCDVQGFILSVDELNAAVLHWMRSQKRYPCDGKTVRIVMQLNQAPRGWFGGAELTSVTCWLGTKP